MKTPLIAVVTLAIPVFLVTLREEDVRDMEPTGKLVVDFARTQPSSWRAVNDGVMGGLSQSRLRGTDAGTAVFMGVVSLENNGGFASVRTLLGEVDLSEYDGLAVRVLGDGKRYRLRLRTVDRFDGIAYQATFDTAEDVWQVVEIPFTSFLPTYRGQTPRDAPPLDISKIRQIGFMIADKQDGRFRLEIAWVRARKAATGGEADR
jgi:monofunctional biosynthetic peptidoglycan transglycosylase